MSHPNPSHDRSNEYPSDHYRPTGDKKASDAKALYDRWQKNQASDHKTYMHRLENKKNDGPLSGTRAMLKGKAKALRKMMNELGGRYGNRK